MVRSKLTRRELLRKAGFTGALAVGSPLVSAALQNGQTPPAGGGPEPESKTAANYSHPPGEFVIRPLTQVSKAADALLDDMEARNCNYFWNEASPNTGLVRDRALWTAPSPSRVASIASTGFGLSALCIASMRNYLTPTECEARVEKTLEFLLEQCPHIHGFFYHFIDIENGQRLFGSELSSIDTSLLLCGILHCRQYFEGNRRIRAMATTIYQRIDWQWMMNKGTTLSMGWLPDLGFLKYRWDIYAEITTMYLMAIGSSTHPIPASTWDLVERPVVSYGGISYISGLAPLFIHQYPEAWCDYRNKRDRHANYFTNSIAATRANQLWCLVLGRKFPWIDQNMWGITASASRRGYAIWGGPPSMGPLDGTLVPCATAGSLVFLPAECSHVLLTIKNRFLDKVYGRYGFADAFQPHAGWFSGNVIGIDVGIGLLMAENLRSGFVWDYFMRNPEITHAMDEVGFHHDPDANSQIF